MNAACTNRNEAVGGVSFAAWIRSRFSDQLHAELARRTALRNVELSRAMLTDVIVTGTERDIVYANVYFDCTIKESERQSKSPYVVDCYLDMRDCFSQLWIRCISPDWPTYQAEKAIPDTLIPDLPKAQLEATATKILREGCTAVATCGTGTRKLIDALKAREIVPPVIVCMDRDSAGDEAAAKLCTQLKAQGVTHLRAATPEGYKDPNELLMGDSELFRSWVRDCVTQAEKLPTLTRRNVNQEIADTEALRALQPESNSRYLSTDIGNSRLYSDYYSSVVRYVPERKLWYIFSGKRWEPDIGGLKAMELCKKLANALMVYAFHISDEQQRKDYIDRCKKWQARRTRETILKDAQGVYPIPMDAFDRDPFLFNCQNGTIHLKDMSFLPHAPEDKITKISDVVYDPDARCERFDQFVDEIMSGDKDRARFLQRSLGYALSGDTRFECLFILYGATTRNGKGTLMESVLKVMGEYGSTVRPETISMKQNASSQNPTEDIARLAGIRFFYLGEFTTCWRKILLPRLCGF